mmetsp:Transcript_64779/g.114340  ORF Transcript_64779/g.114340 Transcript_64779/m.114340 type:complete len:590 (-) Transcript_64779:78-1847(-)|eukprot:CAMPEP_0184997684 /NCGR_PEP_ID=MMETSP1098-20130426/60261_1 /TAXON_ID=89044 /ORGANISM="Spumella elongata, Strain CCAP 955/1" /LENGTH=589 /DNA_ID=CAMNT_0027524361 /DNA_START=25 /DNA_END=1794 /DNA_ORIENTATION=-
MCDTGLDLAITAMSFNADSSFMAITTTEYFSTFNCVPVRRIVKDDSKGGMRCITLLHRSPLVVLVPSGDKPGTSPRRLVLWNCSTKEPIREYGFETTILSCAMNKDFLAVGTEGFISLFGLQAMNLLVKLEARTGSVFALSSEQGGALLAYPSPAARIGKGGDKSTESVYEGMISIYSCGQGRLVSQIKAHKTAVSVLSVSTQGDLLASASVTGSLVRVFRIPEGECIHVLRHSVPTPMSLFSLSLPSSDQQSAADKRVSWIRFCPKGHFLLSATAPSGAKGGYVNVFRVGGVACVAGDRSHSGGSGRSSLHSAEGRNSQTLSPLQLENDDDEEEYLTVQAEDIPSPSALLAIDNNNSKLDGAKKSNDGSWSDWQKQLQGQAAAQLRNLQVLSQEYVTSGTVAARAAATAMGASAMAAAGTRPLLYARIHGAEATHHSLHAGAADQGRGGGGGVGSSAHDIEGHGQVVEDRLSDSSARAHAVGVYGAARGRDGPSFFATLSYVPASNQAALTPTPAPGEGDLDRLALSVISAVGGIYRRYNISFLQSLSIEDSNSSGTVSLSDTRPPSSSSAVPQTLSELLEDECALLE